MHLPDSKLGAKLLKEWLSPIVVQEDDLKETKDPRISQNGIFTSLLSEDPTEESKLWQKMTSGLRRRDTQWLKSFDDDKGGKPNGKVGFDNIRLGINGDAKDYSLFRLIKRSPAWNIRLGLRSPDNY